jgi:MFS transporter, DHA2 family, glioxin efflux transporter
MASTNTVSDGAKPNQTSTSSMFLDPKGEHSDFEQASTRAPSTAADVTSDYDEKKDKAGNVTDEESGEAPPTGEPEPTEASPAEYPTGARLLFIVVALVLSVFLVSLDMVRYIRGVVATNSKKRNCNHASN